MWCFCRSSIAILLIFSLCQYVKSCQNFLVQYCTDIPIGFNSISSIKCIQLIPSSFDSSINYPVQNYIIVKTAQCYNIISYNSSSTILFSNECREQCPEEYCLLFDNQPNTSIINIFYSPSSTYEATNAISINSSSYDYLLFDICSSDNRANQILLIIVYVLCAIVVILTIAVVLKYILSWRLRKRAGVVEPYNWRWIIDFLCCRVRPDDLPPISQEKNPSDSDIMEGNNQLRINTNLDISTQAYMISTGSSNNTQERRNDKEYSSGNSSDQRYRGSSSGNNSSPTLHHQDIPRYFDVATELENEDSSVETDNNQQLSALALLRKLSSKASATFSDSNEYITLEAEPASDAIYFRL